MNIVHKESDYWHFTRALYLSNDKYQDKNWSREVSMDLTQTTSRSLFERPAHWPERDPLVSVLAWVLMPNHFHLLLYEKSSGGVAKFMQRLSGSMTKYHNKKYNEQGSIFQGAYKSRTVAYDPYLHYVVAYIVVKNVFELYPGGLAQAVREFDSAWEWASQYPFSSFQSMALGKPSPIIGMEELAKLGLLLKEKTFKKRASDMLLSYQEKHKQKTSIFLENW